MSAIEDMLMAGQIPAMEEGTTRQQRRELERKIAKYAPSVLVRHANDIGFALYRTEVMLEYFRAMDENFAEHFTAAEQRVRNNMSKHEPNTIEKVEEADCIIKGIIDELDTSGEEAECIISGEQL
jgi:glutaredoxin 2